MDLSLIIPFHNEEPYLPLLIRSLRNQTIQNVPVVFIDNASTDNSSAIVAACEEVKSGRWFHLRENRIGKCYAMRTATAFCRDRFDPPYIGLIDADTYLGDNAWVRNNLEIIAGTNGRCGYTYSSLLYVGLDNLPVFRNAYLAYQKVQELIVENIGWLAAGQGFICRTETLSRYFKEADITTEFDLRCSLLALADRQEPQLNPSMLISSSRRITVNARNFAGWCFYEREFYSKKDINASKKLNLNLPDRIEDMRPRMVPVFFERRAMKLVGRHLLPLAIMDRSSRFFERIHNVLGFDLTDSLSEICRRFQADTGWLLTDQFDEMISVIESHPDAVALAHHLANLMFERYEPQVLSATNARTV